MLVRDMKFWCFDVLCKTDENVSIELIHARSTIPFCSWRLLWADRNNSDSYQFANDQKFFL